MSRRLSHQGREYGICTPPGEGEVTVQTFVCNLCERPLDGTAYEFSTVTGEPVIGDQGITRIARRRHVQLLHLCARCGNWLGLGLRNISVALATASDMRQDPRWLDPESIVPTDYTISTNDRLGH